MCVIMYEQIPKKGKIYSVNEGNPKNWDGPTLKYVESRILFQYLIIMIFYNFCSYQVCREMQVPLRWLTIQVPQIHWKVSRMSNQFQRRIEVTIFVVIFMACWKGFITFSLICLKFRQGLVTFISSPWLEARNFNDVWFRFHVLEKILWDEFVRQKA